MEKKMNDTIKQLNDTISQLKPSDSTPVDESQLKIDEIKLSAENDMARINDQLKMLQKKHTALEQSKRKADEELLCMKNLL